MRRTILKYLISNANLILTGSATYTGSFSSSYTSVNHQSDNLYSKGLINRNTISRNIDMSGQVSVNRSTSVSANIFGYTVTW